MATDLHEPFDELVVGYALSALEPEDEELLKRHLSTCQRCQRELSLHQETLAELAFAVEATPPPTLLAGIRAQIADPQRADRDGPPAQPAVAGAPGAPAVARVPGPSAATRSPREPAASSDTPVGQPVAARPVDELARARDRRRRTAAWSSVAAALALVIGLGTWNITLRNDLNRQVPLTRAVQALQSGPARTVPLRTKSGAVSAIAVVQHDGSVSLVLDGLPTNDKANSTYVLWAVQGISPTAVATFDVASDRPGVLTSLTKVDILPVTADAYAITREDGRQAPATPQHPILVQGLTT